MFNLRCLISIASLKGLEMHSNKNIHLILLIFALPLLAWTSIAKAQITAESRASVIDI